MDSITRLDPITLMVVMATNLFVMALALPLIMGRNVSRSATNVQASLGLQAMAWASMIASSVGWHPFFTTLSIALQGLAQWALYRALEDWLGARPMRHVLIAAIACAPLGHGLLYFDYGARVLWANGMLTVALLVVARATLRPLLESDRRWRYLLCLCLCIGASFSLLRGLLAAFTDQYSSFSSPHPASLVGTLIVNATIVLGTMATMTAWRAETERRLRTLAMTDSLTGLLNRRGFTRHAETLIAQAQRHRLPVTALLLDIDHFKQINDTYGHDMGDRALRLFASVLRETCRSGDLTGRIGGEEFGVLILHNRPRAGQMFDKRLRKKLQKTSVAELGVELNYSSGLAMLQVKESDLEALMKRADRAMYAAKSAGRGRLVAEF